ncbi:MAG TPA: glycosyltransferase family 39 protein [Terriglobales bacterium]|nr:glycosyltransferase family 39 protein [Terriglobales bacterium]
MRRIQSLELIIVAGFCGFLFFYGLGNLGLLGPDEPRYAQVAREMLERDDFITPTLHGEPWLEKPALYYWRAMLAFDTFGVKDWVARLPSATFALGMIVVIFFHMRRFRPGAQLDAALITASCAAVIGFARGASTDMQLAAPFTVAMLGWYAWYETGKKLWLIDLYFFLGIATLAKGPVAPLMAGGIVVIFCGLRHDLRHSLRTLWWPGIILYSVITLPWFIAVQMKNPQFIKVFILEHNLARFSTDTFRHVQPFWFYVPVLLLSLVPWTFFAAPAMVDAVRSCLKDWRSSKGEERANVDSFPEYLVIWAALIVVFFSISRSKLPGYILPAIAPCTILTADYLQRMHEEHIHKLVIASHAALQGILVALALVFPYFFLQGIPMSRQGVVVAVLLAAAFFAMIYLTLLKSGVRLLRFVTLLPLILIMGFFLRVAAPTADNYYSARPVAADIQKVGPTSSPIAVYKAGRAVWYGLAFYRNQRVFNYEEKEIPGTEHLLVTKALAREDLDRVIPGRKRVLLGRFAPQKLEYYWVSAVNHSDSSTR